MTTAHWTPYKQPSTACPCPVQTCGAIIPDPDCPDHGARAEPAMNRHTAGGTRCQNLTADKENT